MSLKLSAPLEAIWKLPGLGLDVMSLLSVSPISEDHDSLQQILGPNARVSRADSVASAGAELEENPVPLIVCERDLAPGTWRDLWAEIEYVPVPPFLIVTSRLADEYLWAEALNVGVYDVLAKPFDTREVVRVVSLAWFRWKDRYQVDLVGGGRVLAAH